MGKPLPLPDGDSEWARRTRLAMLKDDATWDGIGCIVAGAAFVIFVGLSAWALWGG